MDSEVTYIYSTIKVIANNTSCNKLAEKMDLSIIVSVIMPNDFKTTEDKETIYKGNNINAENIAIAKYFFLDKTV